jgi:hypothetical protein
VPLYNQCFSLYHLQIRTIIGRSTTDDFDSSIVTFDSLRTAQKEVTLMESNIEAQTQEEAVVDAVLRAIKQEGDDPFVD